MKRTVRTRPRNHRTTAIPLFLDNSGFPFVCFLFSMLLLWIGDLFPPGRFGVPAALFFYMLSAFPIAVSFYRMKRRFRLMYGLFELAAACALFFVTLLGMIHPTDVWVFPNEKLLSRGLTFLALIYFMVRALENIGEGFNPSSSSAKKWNSVFPKREAT